MLENTKEQSLDRIEYPYKLAPRGQTIDKYKTKNGKRMVSVPDPYRFLEDRESKETQQWVEAENKLTSDFLGKFTSVTQKIADRLKFLSDSPKMSFPEKHGDYFYFLHSRGGL